MTRRKFKDLLTHPSPDEAVDLDDLPEVEPEPTPSLDKPKKEKPAPPEEPTMHLVGNAWSDEGVTVRLRSDRYARCVGQKFALCECVDAFCETRNIVGHAVIKNSWSGTLGSIPARLVEQEHVASLRTYSTLCNGLANVYGERFLGDRTSVVALSFKRP